MRTFTGFLVSGAGKDVLGLRSKEVVIYLSTKSFVFVGMSIFGERMCVCVFFFKGIALS